MRTVKGTRKVNEWEKAPGSYITCQKCGKILQKSLQTNSVIYCPRCGNENFVYLENSIKMQFPARLLEADNSTEYVKAAVIALRKLRTAPVKEFIPGMDPE